VTNVDPNYFRKDSIRAVVTEIAKRFTPVDAARKLIVERTLLIIMDKPELDLGDPVRELLPVIRQVALDHFHVGAESPMKESHR